MLRQISDAQRPHLSSPPQALAPISPVVAPAAVFSDKDSTDLSAEMDHLRLESCAADSRLGGAEDDEGLEVFGRPEGVYFEAR